jgi:hypothetical protein
MPAGYFVVQNGLQVGPLTIDATSGTIQTSGDVNITGNVGVSQIAKNDSSITITDSGGGSNIQFKIDNDIEHTMTAALTSLRGNLSFSPDNTADAFATSAGLTNAVGVAAKNVNAFVQFALTNTDDGTSSSTDFIAYSDNADNDHGFIDMGIASTLFSDPDFAVTKGGDGYIFLSAPSYLGNGNPTGGNLVLATDGGAFGDIVFAANGFSAGASTEQGRFKKDDGLYISGNLVANGGTIYQGPLAKEFEALAAITDPAALFTGNIDSFAQVALHNRNSGASASADYIAYADRSDNDNGFIDMGICGSLFSDPAFAVTNAGDGYIFLSAPAYANTTPTGGNLVLATADGAFGDIVFSAGGFATGAIQGRFVNNDGLLVTGNLVSEQGAVYQGLNSRDQLISANSSTTLSTTVNAAVTTWSVASTTGFLNHGVLYCESEIVYYSGKTINSFTGITRGTGGTTAASHNSGRTIYQPIAGLTNVTAVFVDDANDFVQLAIKNKNSGTGASTDLIAYASNGDNDSGWIDLGITGENFDDPSFGVTGRDDGYIFMSAPAGTPGDGSLYISTDGTGQKNDIVFSTGGFADSTFERMRIIGKDRAGKPAGVEIYIPTTSTSTSTGALRIQGGVGIQGNLNVGGNFNLTGNITIGGTGSTTSTSTLTIENPINFLANANTGDSQDSGIVTQYESGGTKYTGVVREAATDSWRFFEGLSTKPTTTVSWGGSTAANVYMGQLLIANSTASSSTTTGALQVRGGVGVSGAIQAGGDVNFSSNTQASNDTTGALRVKGGIAIETGSLYAGGAAGVAVNVRGDIRPTANLTYNIGSSSAWFNTFFGVSTQAKYADLAENYQADAHYDAGTVLEFGGEREVTIATDGTKRVAGVVSTNPAHLMNGSLTGQNVVPLALQGRVPCKVTGAVQKGDLMVSAGFGYAKANNDAQIGQVIGKALADFSGTKGTIEIVVGRL